MIAEFMKGASHVGFNGIFGQAQLFGNFPVRVALPSAESKNELAFFGQGGDGNAGDPLQAGG